MFCLLGVLSVNHVSAQEEASGGAKLKNENDYFMREENSSLKVKGNVYGSSSEDDELVSTETIIADVPSIARLKFEQKEDNNWKFSTKGHYLNISGYNRGMKKVQLTDPNIRRLFGNDATGKYDVTIKELCQALNDHPNHHLYW